MAKSKNPADVAKKWADRTRNAVPAYVEGVQAVTSSPTQAAADAVDLYAAGVQRAVQSGKFTQSLQSVSLEDWKRKAVNKGKANIATGVAESQADVQKVMTTLLPHTQMVSDTVRAMPKGTLEDSKQRALKAIDLMATYQRPR